MPRWRRAAGWRSAGGRTAGVLELTVEDEGPGLPDPGNLFVPFFTTKASGSGIGLVLEPPDRRGARRRADAGAATGGAGRARAFDCRSAKG